MAGSNREAETAWPGSLLCALNCTLKNHDIGRGQSYSEYNRIIISQVHCTATARLREFFFGAQLTNNINPMYTIPRDNYFMAAPPSRNVVNNNPRSA